MLDQQVRDEVIRREGDAASRISPDADHEPNEATEAFWQSWLEDGARLQAMGFSQRTQCDALGTIAEVREEFARDRERTATG